MLESRCLRPFIPVDESCSRAITEAWMPLKTFLPMVAGVAKLAYAQDLKSCGPKGPYGFDPRLLHHDTLLMVTPAGRLMGIQRFLR